MFFAIDSRDGRRTTTAAKACLVAVILLHSGGAAATDDEPRRSVSGVVVDTEGQPVKGVRVFASNGSRYSRAEATTDVAGRFTLSAVLPDLRYVFADCPKYRPGGTTVGDGPISICLRKVDGPPVGLRPVINPDQKEQFKIIRPLLEQIWSSTSSPTSPIRSVVIESMVRIDSEVAKSMSESVGGYFDDVIRIELATGCFRTDPDRSLELLRETVSPNGVRAACKLGTRFARSQNPNDHRIALKFAEVAEQLADKQKEPAKSLADVARLFALLRKNDRAATLIDHTLAEINRRKAANQNVQYALLSIAPTIALYDYKKATALVDDLESEFERNETLANIAVAVAATDPDRSLKIIGELKGDNNTPSIRDRGRLNVVLARVGRDIEFSKRAIQQFERDDNRSEALGILGARMAEIDRQRSWQLIESAFGVHRHRPVDTFASWTNYGGGGPFAARLAWQAQQTGYPDMESVVWQVLAACRSITVQGSRPGEPDRVRATIATARVLALVDQSAARELLNSVKSESSISRGGSLLELWIQAWLFVDFDQGVKLLKKELDRYTRTGKNPIVRYENRWLVRLLTASTDERFTLVTNDGPGYMKELIFD